MAPQATFDVRRIEIPQVGGVWASAGGYADVAAAGGVAVGDAHAEG